VCRRRGEDHFIRPRSDDHSDDLAGLLQRLRGKSPGTVEAGGITPSGLLGIKPGLSCDWEERLAR
jgi:hypothetical protein